MQRLILLLALAAAPVSAEVTVTSCPLVIESTEGAEAVVASDGKTVTHTSIGVFGESGRTEIDISPLGDKVTLVEMRRITYEKPDAEDVGAQTLTGGARLIIEGDTVCKAAFCANYWGDLAAESAETLLGEVSVALQKPEGCGRVWPE